LLGYVRKLWAASPWATTVAGLGLLLALLFTLRLVIFSIYWSDPANRDQAIASWMTPGYIAHSWQVPREVVLKALNTPVPPPKGPMNLDELAAYLGVPVQDLVAAAEAAIADHRAGETEQRP